MNLLELIAFTFHFERFSQPAVIAGVCIMVVGLILNFCAKPIANAISKKRKAKGEIENTDMLYMSFKYVSVGLVLIGVLMAIIKMQY
ncbi:MAG: hypothetical protein K2G37_02120 [Clostridia bacterium]|nr:hypothetical protein [Clostridia bacterium]MDE7329380.1 hypothetical protein [Clostridia bacterium]